MGILYDNSRPLNFSRWSQALEVERVVDAVYAEYRARVSIQRETNQRDCIKLILLNLYLNHKSDADRLTRYSRNKSLNLVRRYNPVGVSVAQVIERANHLEELGYLTTKIGDKWSLSSPMKQSTMTATAKLIELFLAEKVTPIMVTSHEKTETIILKDSDKRLTDYTDTKETKKMREELKLINQAIDGALINLYLLNDELADLNHRMKTGKLSSDTDYLSDDEEEEVEVETPRGAIDFTAKSLRRVFNDRTFKHGGRLYGGFWQGIPGNPIEEDPRGYRKYIKIDQLDTVEVDFSGMHVNLIYWLQGLPIPDGDLYSLEGFPAGTRDVTKACVLTLINAKTREKGMRSLQERASGVKSRFDKTLGERVELPVPKNNRIKVPDGTTLEAIVAAFERKHSEIAKKWFFSGKGVELQRYDSDLAVAILLKLAKKSIVCLPVHDSFIVIHWHESALRAAMVEAFFEMTGRIPNMTRKDSLFDENKAKAEAQGEEVLEKEYREKMQGGAFSPEFREKYSVYVNSVEEWKRDRSKVEGECPITIRGYITGASDT